MKAPRSPRRLMASTLVAATAATGIAVIAPAAVSHANTGCASVFNLFIPGTWETSATADPTQTVGMLAPVAQTLTREHGARVENYFLPYMARAFDNGHTYADSKTTAVTGGQAVLRDYAARCPTTKFTLTGYSQGADAAGDLAADIGNNRGPITADKVLAVGLLADPGSGTKGESTVGPKGTGQGIAGTRAVGMGTLSGRVASICDTKDLYCNTNGTSNPFLKALGNVLTKSPGSADQSNGTQTGANPSGGNLASTLTSDFSKADFTSLGTTLSDLSSKVTAPTGVDLAGIVTDVTKLVNTLSPLSDLVSSGAANPAATTKLTTSPTGTAENNTGQLLTQASKSDLSGALSTLTSIGDIANKLVGQGVQSLNSGSTDLSSLAGSITTLGTQVQRLTSLSSTALSGVTGVLSVLKPNTMINQALNVVTNVISIDWTGILNNLVLLPQRVAALDAQGAHKVAGELNNQFAPLVKLAAGVDLKWISTILAIIPDPQGIAQIASLVVSILANVDIVRIANDVGQIQEIAWTALEKLLPPAGQNADPAAAMATLTGLLPIGLDLASVAVNALTGTAQKTSVDQLGKSNSTTQAVSTISNQASTLNLSGLVSSIANMAGSQGASDLSTLITDGLSAASFFTSGAHQNYGNLTVDNNGRTAVQWLGDWESLQIGRSAA
ncbi:cutinase family protein [Nocardia tengchongensis]|uniref:cutinase family protein n=1 Tax=Nocardia tengchongensis TaxID=2055889 RepID=UPI0036516B56